ncbi:hypothetical protein BGW36DRAFT_374457 [Talaromyces proteolyticus]|uniref:Calponin-homology (CH) domain-containing protein n=1 Tax=Talaromyces proteolyticus TaxID=1131652 RepID=A0AAD4Q096_9EURO|nr:uncharacterized protein BGW36DRAFT_374457 [Talaromyces proteolyticus]KAH8700579.1 hypothetical protein BGW36DRAFT_374457 [Talaromyces proteolyticus]
MLHTVESPRHITRNLLFIYQQPNHCSFCFGRPFFLDRQRVVVLHGVFEHLRAVFAMNSHMDSPCPAGSNITGTGLSSEQEYPWSGPLNDGTLDDFDTTAAIDFTTEIRLPSLTREKPRRAHKKSTFAIHDEGAKATSIIPLPSTVGSNSLKRKTQDGRSSLFAQPAQRFQRPRVSGAGKQCSTNKGISIDAGRRGEVEGKSNQKEIQTQNTKMTLTDDDLKKDARRQTVYIPTEDTTVPAIFMNLFSPLKSDRTNPSTSQHKDETVPINSLETRIAAKKTSRASSRMSIAPRGAPLQQSTKVTQQRATHSDILGKNGGKENIPPGCIIGGGKEFSAKDEGFPIFGAPVRKPLQNSVKTARKTQSRSLNKARKDADSKSRKSVYKASQEKPSTGLMTRAKHTKTKSKTHEDSPLARSINRPPNLSTNSHPIVPHKLAISHIRPVNIDRQYPLLDDDILNPIMYEENWLLHQEIVITQLVNGLFDSTDGKLDTRDSDTLRHGLLQIYQSETFLLLYKRLQASILYGALSPPKEILRRGNRLPDDMGMKRAFLNFWLDTYDLHALRAAAEVVIGRKISNTPFQPYNGPSDSTTKQNKGLKRTLDTFLEKFLLRNEDKERNAASQDEMPGSLYRRTVLRSIMIIILLDKGRISSNNLLPRSLFSTSSPFKTSTTALQALANQLLPSIGDITRQLNHLDCQLSYSQHELQDYEFRINNLAVDLRDGVILTRLTELLLYAGASHLFSDKDGIDSITLTDKNVAPRNPKNAETETEWPLSQHLKFPCTSRATKVFNVQIVLQTLSQATDFKNMVRDVCAEDIVDGHREKTIALLWELVGKWGLPELIDWNDVRSEIKRLQKKLPLTARTVIKEDEESENLVFVSHQDLLMKWASTLAQLKGLELNKFNTSFIDGRIFESIIDEYELYLGGEQKSQCLTSKALADDKVDVQHSKLRMRLQSLGCSSQFASLVSPSSTESHIFDDNFVLGALTFLCSRLLVSSKRIRAAIIIQTAWRHVLACRNLHRRILAKEVAEQCAAVVRARSRILWAKGVILQWWRKQNRKEANTTMDRANEGVRLQTSTYTPEWDERGKKGDILNWPP